MANQYVEEGRKWFKRELTNKASEKGVSIDAQWNDVPPKDESELVITSSRKAKKVWIIDNFQLENYKVNSADLIQLIDVIVASLP